MQRRLRLLWVTPYLPRRGVSAAREHWWSLIGQLARRHDITLLAFTDPDDGDAAACLPPGLSAVHRVLRRPWRTDDPLALLPRTVAGAYADPAFAAAVATRLAAEIYDLVQYECVEMGQLIPETRVPSILSVVQVGFAQEGPRWRAEGRPLGRGAILMHRYLRALDFELRAVGRVHHVVTMSAQDAVRLRRFHPTLRVSVIPLGVDCEHFAPGRIAPGPAVDLLFVGNFGHRPNADAVRFLLADVLPRLGRPVSLRVVGHGATQAVGDGARTPGVSVPGPVADVRAELAAARVVVAPVRFGTGMRGKVLEALAMARPVVTTALGAEGLQATPDRDLLVADGAYAFTAAVRRVLDDEALGRQLGAGGRALVETRFDWHQVARTYESVYEQVLREPGPAPRWAPDPAATWAPRINHLGRWPAVAAGTGLLLARGIRWHLRRMRVRGDARVSARSKNRPLGAQDVRAR